MRRVQRFRIADVFRQLVADFGRTEAERRLRARYASKHRDLVESVIASKKKSR